MSDRKTPTNDEIDAELALAIMGYDRTDKYPEWSNAAMREAYRGGWEDGRDTAVAPIRALHRRTDSGFCSEACIDHHGNQQPWPCDTARLVYTVEEVAQ